MGCDIHAHIEIRLHGESRWHHYSAPNIGRSYALFSRMAGVREKAGYPAIAEPRGFVPDPSIITEIHYADDGLDAHTPSWLHGWELQQIIDEFENRRHALNEEVQRRAGEFRAQGITAEVAAARAGSLSFHTMHDTFGWLFGNGFDMRAYPDEYPDVLADVRIVFWFDN